MFTSPTSLPQEIPTIGGFELNVPFADIVGNLIKAF